MISTFSGLRDVGGGPWRVLPLCMAARHNTAYAARGRSGKIRCECPRAVWLLRQINKSDHEKRVAAAKAAGLPASSLRHRTSPLPGGGPWMVLVECPAVIHNTVRSVTRGPSRYYCICPRAQALKNDDDLRRASHRGLADLAEAGGAAALAVRRRRNPLWFVGGGPWRLEAGCPAAVHNTLAAARGTRVPDGLKCLCPRAQALKTDYSNNQRARKKLIGMGVTPEDGRRNNGKPKGGPRWDPEKAIAQASYFANTLVAATPSMPRAACKTPEGIKLSDLASEGRAGYEGEMKSLCGGCAERVVCATWVLSDERHAGEWGGVYGGMSVGDRRRISERRAAPKNGAAA